MTERELPVPTLAQVREDIERQSQRGQMIVLLPRDVRLLLAEIDRLTTEAPIPQQALSEGSEGHVQ